jgi:DnaK suppressor protein
MGDLPVYAELLQQRVDQAQRQREALLVAISDLRTTRSLTLADDEHDPEGSTVSLDQARDVALLGQIEKSLMELNAARDRLAAGTYGRCEACGREIPSARLEVRPEARLCLRHHRLSSRR